MRIKSNFIYHCLFQNTDLRNLHTVSVQDRRLKKDMKSTITDTGSFFRVQALEWKVKQESNTSYDSFTEPKPHLGLVTSSDRSCLGVSNEEILPRDLSGCSQAKYQSPASYYTIKIASFDISSRIEGWKLCCMIIYLNVHFHMCRSPYTTWQLIIDEFFIW